VLGIYPFAGLELISAQGKAEISPATTLRQKTVGAGLVPAQSHWDCFGASAPRNDKGGIHTVLEKEKAWQRHTEALIPEACYLSTSFCLSSRLRKPMPGGRSSSILPVFRHQQC